jgi:hypothetical protein
MTEIKAAALRRRVIDDASRQSDRRPSSARWLTRSVCGVAL